MSTIARLGVKVDRISEKLHRKASKLGNRETVKLHQSKGGNNSQGANLEGGQKCSPR